MFQQRSQSSTMLRAVRPQVTGNADFEATPTRTFLTLVGVCTAAVVFWQKLRRRTPTPTSACTAAVPLRGAADVLGPVADCYPNAPSAGLCCAPDVGAPIALAALMSSKGHFVCPALRKGLGKGNVDEMGMSVPLLTVAASGPPAATAAPRL